MYFPAQLYGNSHPEKFTVLNSAQTTIIILRAAYKIPVENITISNI